MKVKLPIIGLELKTRSGKQEPPKVKQVNEVLGGVFSNSVNSLSGQTSISTKLLEANKEWVYRNNDVIAKEVAQTEFQLFRMGITGGEIVFNEVDDHPILDALDRFNDSTTRSDALYNTQSHKKLTGDAFWLMDWQGTELRNIFLLQPDKIELIIGNPTDATDELIEGYKYKDTINNKQIEVTYRPDQIIHFKTPNPKNPFRGYGAVEALADTIDLDSLTNEVTRKFFENGAIAQFILWTESKLNPDQLKRLNAQFRAAHGGGILDMG